MKRDLLAPFLVLFATSIALAAQSFTATGTASLALGTEQARQQALINAQWEAVQQAGVALTGGTLHHEEERRGSNTEDYFDSFSKLISSEAGGKIISYQILKEDIEKYPGPQGALEAYYAVTITAEVEPDTSRFDPTFQLDLTLLDEKLTYRESEGLVVILEATQPCWITVFNLYSDNQARVISPNRIWGNPRQPAHVPWEIPPPKIRENIGDMADSLPPGLDNEVRMLLAVAYKDSASLFDDYQKFNRLEFPTYDNALEQINQWLLRIPRDRRTSDLAVYRVIK